MTLSKVLADYLLTIPPQTGNSKTYDLFSILVQAGFPKTDDMTFPPGDPRNGPSIIEPEDWYISLDDVFTWCDAGAEILAYSGAYHELTEPTILCPYSEDTGEPGWVQETWESWGVVGDSHAPIQIGAFWYRSTLEGVQGTPLPCTRWYDFTRQPNTNTTGIERMISTWEFQQIQAAAA